ELPPPVRRDPPLRALDLRSGAAGGRVCLLSMVARQRCLGIDGVTIRSATEGDADQVASVYLTSRKAFVAFAPLAHSADEVRGWIANTLIPGGGVKVAVDEKGEVVGMMAVSQESGIGWIDQLYLLPSAVGRGLGTRFVDLAKETLGSPIRLYTFQENAGAR